MQKQHRCANKKYKNSLRNNTVVLAVELMGWMAFALAELLSASSQLSIPLSLPLIYTDLAVFLKMQYFLKMSFILKQTNWFLPSLYLQMPRGNHWWCIAGFFFTLLHLPLGWISLSFSSSLLFSFLWCLLSVTSCFKLILGEPYLSVAQVLPTQILYCFAHTHPTTWGSGSLVGREKCHAFTLTMLRVVQRSLIVLQLQSVYCFCLEQQFISS